MADCAYGDANDTTCWTERYDLPKVNNWVQVVMESKTALATRLQASAPSGGRIL